MSVIANTTVISNFASIGQLACLRQLYSILYISTGVYEEMQAGLEEGYQFYRDVEQLIYPFSPAGWIRLTGLADGQELHNFSTLPSHLHYGEASCLAIAQNRGWLFLTDDLAARKTATQLGIQLSGSIGCLVLAIERDLCSLEQANTWLGEMIASGYHSPIHDLAPLVSEESKNR